MCVCMYICVATPEQLGEAHGEAGQERTADGYNDGADDDYNNVEDEGDLEKTIEEKVKSEKLVMEESRSRTKKPLLPPSSVRGVTC